MTRVLVVEDEESFSDALSFMLRKEGFEVGVAADGPAALEAFDRQGADLVLLDLMLPGLSGTEVCRALRATSNVPIIMVTAKDGEVDKVVGLELGADDYVAKPFSPRELLARLRAVTRRGQPGLLSERLSAGGIVIDVGTRQVTREGRVIELTAVEFDILVALMRRAGRVVPRTALLSEAGRGDVNVGERTIDVHISRLRRQIGDDPKAATRIQTIRGVGYMLTREGEE